MHCKIEVEVTQDEGDLSFKTSRQGNVPKPIYLMALEYAKFQLMGVVPDDNEAPKREGV